MSDIKKVDSLQLDKKSKDLVFTKNLSNRSKSSNTYKIPLEMTTTEHNDDNYKITTKFKIINQLEKYYRSDLQHLKKTKRKLYSSRKFKIITEIIYIIFSLLLSLMSLFIYIIYTFNIVMTDFRLKLFFIDFSMAHIFFLEMILIFFISKDKFNYFLSYEPWIDIISLISNYLALCVFGYNFKLSFICILKFLKISKLLKLFQLLRITNKEIIFQSEENISSSTSFTKVQKLLSKLIIYLISMIFIISGIIQQLSLFSPSSMNLEFMNFIDAFYFVIITVSTVGYGDIYPNSIATKFFMVVIIFVFVYTIAYQLTMLIMILNKRKKLTKNMKFTDHIVIIGDFPHSNLTQIHLINFFEEFYSNYYVSEEVYDELSPVCILLTLKQANKENKNLSKLKDFPWYNTKVFHFCVNKYDYEAFCTANFEYAKALLCLNYNVNSDYMITDKLMCFNKNNLEYFVEDMENRNFYCNSKYLNYLINNKKIFTQYLYKEENTTDLSFTLNEKIPQINIPRMNLKYSMIAKNIFVKGWITFITNLINNYKINLDERNVTENYYMNYYLSGMNQNLIIGILPKFLYGINFNKCMKDIYATSIEYKNKIKSDSFGHYRTYSTQEKFYLNEILLIGIIEIEKSQSYLTINEAEEIFKNIDEGLNNQNLGFLVKNIEFNPINLTISENNYGVFICNDFLILNDFFQFMYDKQLNHENKDKNNYNYMSTQSHCYNMLRKYFNHQSKINDDFKNDENIGPKLTNYNIRYKSYGLMKIDDLNDHIILLGWNFNLDHLIEKIRIHSKRRSILIIADQIPDHKNLLKKFSNLYIVEGDYLDLDILININTFKASFAIIIPSKSSVNSNNEDSNSVLVARIISQHFNIPYLIEITESKNINFLGRLPVVEEFNSNKYSRQVSKNLYIYPNFIEGKVLFNCIFDQINSKVLFESLKILSLKELIQLDFKKNFNLVNIIDNKLTPKDVIYNNTNIRIFSLPLDFYYSDKTYKDLTMDLLQLRFIPLGLYNRIHSKIENIEYSNIDVNSNLNVKLIEEHKIMQNIQTKLKTFRKLLKEDLNQNILEYVNIEQTQCSLFITNPPTDIKLNSQMEVIIIGI